MTLVLRIGSYRGAAPAGQPSVTFGERGGSIGRAEDNDWVLPDPDRYISSRHAAVSFRDGRYYVTDTSLNGLLVNGQPLGQGNTTVLNDGDVLGFGDYEVVVSVTAPSAARPAFCEPEAPAFLPQGDIGLEPVLAEQAGVPATRKVPVAEEAPAGPFGEPFTTPFSGTSGEPASEPGPPMRDDLPRIHEPFQPPEARRDIPENWWEEMSPAVEPAPAGPPSPAAPLPPPPEPSPRPAIEAVVPPAPETSRVAERSPVIAGSPLEATWSLPAPEPPGPLARPGEARVTAPPPPVAAETPREVAAALAPNPEAAPVTLAAALLRGAGLDPGALGRDGTDTEVVERTGRLLHVMVAGIRELLAARASVKQAGGIEMTTIRAARNNPLKFTVTTEEALGHLLRRDPAPGFLPPIESVAEVMHDLKAHEVANLAGLEAKLRWMFARFDPTRLEQEFADRSLLGSLMPGHRKARCWDLFTAEFRRMAAEAQEDVQALFGREFARAYEEQVHRLRDAPGGPARGEAPAKGGKPP